MSNGADEFDELAYALVESTYDFDAVESGALRATWADDGLTVRVVDRETDEAMTYSAEDLLRATSDREVRRARQPEG